MSVCLSVCYTKTQKTYNNLIFISQHQRLELRLGLRSTRRTTEQLCRHWPIFFLYNELHFYLTLLILYCVQWVKRLRQKVAFFSNQLHISDEDVDAKNINFASQTSKFYTFRRKVFPTKKTVRQSKI